MARQKIIPKRIGNVKIPKNLRKFGDRVLADPRAREAAASALLAIGTALLSRGTRKGSVLRDILDHPAQSARAARDAGSETASKGADTVGDMAETASRIVGEVIDAIRRDVARKIRPVRPRHAHDDHDAEDRPEAGDDRMH